MCACNTLPIAMIVYDVKDDAKSRETFSTSNDRKTLSLKLPKLISTVYLTFAPRFFLFDTFNTFAK